MFESNSEGDLKRALAEGDIAVPLRTKGRTKDHTEKYTASHLLSALLRAGMLTYPISLIHRDRPDFLLCMGLQQIGIEHVEAISQNEAHRKILRERGYGPDTHFIAHQRPGEPKKKAKSLIDEIEKNTAGDGWEGNTVEMEWAAVMLHFIKQKANVVRKQGFKRFDEDWLLIYDNWTLPGVEREDAAAALHNLVILGGGLPEFRHVFIMSGRFFCQVSDEGTRLHFVNDLWSHNRKHAPILDR